MSDPWFHNGLRQPRPPKPHIMLKDGWWYIVDPPFHTWRQWQLPRTDPRPKTQSAR